jgi:hypothetical protein
MRRFHNKVKLVAVILGASYKIQNQNRNEICLITLMEFDDSLTRNENINILSKFESFILENTKRTGSF